ncbi:MAG: aldo/keto reductase, partial [Devosia sp.]
SKGGIRKVAFDFSEEHILAAVDGSLAALRTDYLDLLLLHRPDTLVKPPAHSQSLLGAIGAT